MENINVDSLSEIIDNIIEFCQHFADLVQRLFKSISFKRGWDGEEYTYKFPENDPDYIAE